MKRYVLECGHLTSTPPYECSRCHCSTVILEINNKYDMLDKRQAINVLTGEKKKSSWDLPGFKYCPQENYDKFFTLTARRRYIKYYKAEK